jgi:ABC-type multidrug transport system ATPase subunit
MAMLEPKLAILDETDSGLDIDALRIVAEGVNTLKKPDNAYIVITHYQRLLEYIVPDVVHILHIFTAYPKKISLRKYLRHTIRSIFQIKKWKIGSFVIRRIGFKGHIIFLLLLS